MKVLLFFIVLKITNAQFLQQPDSGTIFFPVQDQVTLTCSVENGYVIDWHVVFVNGDEANAANTIHHVVLTNQNFTLEGVVTNRSRLSLWETETQANNGTNITCIAYNSNIQPTSGNTIQVIFFGIPPPPTNLSVTEKKLSSLYISWSLEFIERVPVNYTLTVLNLNTTSAQPIIITGLRDQYYVFKTSRRCDVYSFTVTAVTAAGNSTPSHKLSSETCSTTDSDGTEIYIGITIGAALAALLTIVILLCCFYGKKAKRCIKSHEEQQELQLYDLTMRKNTKQSVTENLQSPEAVYAILDKSKTSKIDKSVVEAEVDSLYAKVDKSKKRQKSGMKVSVTGSSQSPEVLYSQVNKNKKKSLADEEAEDKVKALQVNKSKKNKLADEEPEDKVKALYSKVDKNKKRTLANREAEEKVGALYAKVNKKK